MSHQIQELIAAETRASAIVADARAGESFLQHHNSPGAHYTGTIQSYVLGALCVPFRASNTGCK